MARRAKAAPAKFQAMPGIGWAFPKSTIGPIEDQQIVITGMLPLTTEQTLFIDMRLPVKGGTLEVKIKDPTDWHLIAQFEMPKPEFENQARRHAFKIGTRNYTLVITNGMTRPTKDIDGKRCLRLRIPEILPMPLL